MPLTYTAAYSSRITKPKTKHPFKTPTSSSLSSRKRKPSKLSRETDEDGEAIERLADHGIIHSLATSRNPTTITQLVEQIHDTMFEDIPERAGMNSTRIAEVLNYQKNLPPIATIAHIHALSHGPTAIEREIAGAIQRNIIRRVSIPGRGAGSTSIGDSIITVDQWCDLVAGHRELGDALIKKYVELLRSYQSTTGITGSQFLPHEIVALLRTGFLTSSSHPSVSSPPLLRMDSSSLGTLASLSSVGARAASGSLAAVGGNNAIHEAGGSGGIVGADRADVGFGTEYTLSVPSMGIYLKLLEIARTHLVSLLSKSRYKEAPRYLIKERWDGGVEVEPKSSRKGVFNSILPGKTKKWKHFYGLSFDWVLAECLGSGLVEVFDTGSVGHGIRIS